MHVLAATILWFTVKDENMPHSALDWVMLCVGLSGTAIFGFRFFIQWMHSERHKESRIPISFWWLSVAGTIMAATYFIYKQQWVALLGNGPQLVPYTRNLVLIYRKKAQPPSPPAPPAAAVQAVAAPVRT